MPILDPTGVLSQGLNSSILNQNSSIIASGMPVTPTAPTAIPPVIQNVQVYDIATTTGLNPTDVQLTQSIPYNTVTNFNDYNAINDPSTLIGQITPYLNPGGGLKSSFSSTGQTFAGSDIKALIELSNQSPSSAPSRLYKQLVELTTISVSIHRVKSPARACGFIGAKGYARGTRTIAGSMIFTKFTCDVLCEFLQDGIIKDVSKDSQYRKIDQLPPFDMTLLFANEYGFVSYQRLLGIDFLTDGSVYSSQDAYSENQVSYVASDFTPLLPYTQGALFNLTSSAASAEKTVQNVWSNENPTNSSGVGLV